MQMHEKHLPVGTKAQIHGFWADHYVNGKGLPEVFEILGYSSFEGAWFYHGRKDNGDTFEVSANSVRRVI